MVFFFKRKKDPVRNEVKIVSRSKVKYSADSDNKEAVNDSSEIKKNITKSHSAKKVEVPNATVAKIITTSCPCCGTILMLPTNLLKFKCVVCQVSTSLQILDTTTVNKEKKCSLAELKRIIGECYKNFNDNKDKLPKGVKSKLFIPIQNYLRGCFHDIDILNNSFKSDDKNELINIKELTTFYKLIMKIPSRKPLYGMLCACNDLLKKPGRSLIRTEGDAREEHFRWILIIWHNPVIRDCLTYRSKTAALKSNRSTSPEINSVAYELAKRCIGYMSNIYLSGSKVYFAYLNYLKNLPLEILIDDIETVNLYITFQLSRILQNNRSSGQKNRLKKTNSIYYRPIMNPLMNVNSNPNEIVHSVSNNIENENSWNPNNIDSDIFEKLNTKQLSTSQDFKFKPYEYNSDWYIKCAANLMMLFKTANEDRDNKRILTSSFYNTMLDFIDFKQDFDNWRRMKLGNRKSTFRSTSKGSDSLSYVKGTTMCQYPILLSLGVKISIMCYEVKRIMEFEAEQAFLKSLNKGKVFDVYFKIKVRRNHITHDSLNYLKSHQRDLLKSLRIEFINEPGIDAGGLRKEWFLLLTKSLFDPLNGLFTDSNEIDLSWFAIHPQDFELENDELYYLFGIVLGLAIFNSTIVDLRFPKAFYKKLCKESINFGDYMELYPETGQNLLKMLNYSADDFTDVFGLTFETTYNSQYADLKTSEERGKNGSQNHITVELCEGGRDIAVTNKNKDEFIKSWFNFYMNKSIEKQFTQFSNGFHEVFSQCESSKLFNSEELEKLICGDKKQDCYDFAMLRSVAKYSGGFNDQSQVVKWFWEIVQNWDLKIQRKMLLFVSGSDRVPATGISTIPFKISRLGPTLYHIENKILDEVLPIAHTCFNELCLWEYKSEDSLESKLFYAITESEGYGFK